MHEKLLIEYYNKFNEDKRLTRRHGKIEFITSLKYIHEYLKNFENPKILDVGAGTGKYSIALADEGYDVTAVELVKHNLRVIEKNSTKVKVFLGNAIDLSRFDSEVFDMVLLFGPMYHLYDEKDKIKALEEAKRVLKKNGVILVAYCKNEYAVITHAFKENYINECSNLLDDNFHCLDLESQLYSYVRIEDINRYNKIANLKRIKIISPDGCANYIRDTLNKMDEDTFNKFLEYHFKTCERMDLIGASAHTLDILKKD